MEVSMEVDEVDAVDDDSRWESGGHFLESTRAMWRCSFVPHCLFIATAFYILLVKKEMKKEEEEKRREF